MMLKLKLLDDNGTASCCSMSMIRNRKVDSHITVSLCVLQKVDVCVYVLNCECTYAYIYIAIQLLQ